MALIVVIDDDAGTRMLVSRVLQKEGHQVLTAEDGVQGLILIGENQPNLVVSDVQMPHKDGFEVVAAVRASADLGLTPIILLTSLDDRSNMRLGMTQGADDYLTKPFTPPELLAAVNAQLQKQEKVDNMASEWVGKAVTVALEEQKERISRLYEKRLERVISDQWPISSGLSEDTRYGSASILYADLANYDAWADKLTGTELGHIIKMFYANAGDTIYLFNAHYMHFVGNGLLCVFVDSDDSTSVNHAMRAAKTALALQASCSKIDAYVKEHMARRQLPAFEVLTAIHSGPVIFSQLEGALGTKNQQTPVGRAVSVALNLYREQRSFLPWPVSITHSTLEMLGQRAQTDQSARVRSAGELIEVYALRKILNA